MNYTLENIIKSLYSDESNILMNNHTFSDMQALSLHEDIQHKYDTFHAQDVFMVERDDERFCGIRANHFVVEYGFSEDAETNWNTHYFLITANHKGLRSHTMIRTPFSLQY